MSRSRLIALVVVALLLAGPTPALATGEDAEADKKPATTEDAKKKDDATKDDTTKQDEAQKKLEDAKFNTLEDLFAQIESTLPLTIADASNGTQDGTTADGATAPGVQWRRVETTRRQSE